jgi:hypothetical protein
MPAFFPGRTEDFVSLVLPFGEIQGRREWTKNADTRLWVKNAIRRCHTGETRSPSGRTNLRKVASSYEKEKDSGVHVGEKDTDGIGVRLPRQSRAAWSHTCVNYSTVLLPLHTYSAL